MKGWSDAGRVRGESRGQGEGFRGRVRGVLVAAMVRRDLGARGAGEESRSGLGSAESRIGVGAGSGWEGRGSGAAVEGQGSGEGVGDAGRGCGG